MSAYRSDCKKCVFFYERPLQCTRHGLIFKGWPLAKLPEQWQRDSRSGNALIFEPAHQRLQANCDCFFVTSLTDQHSTQTFLCVQVG